MSQKWNIQFLEHPTPDASPPTAKAWANILLYFYYNSDEDSQLGDFVSNRVRRFSNKCLKNNFA